MTGPYYDEQNYAAFLGLLAEHTRRETSWAWVLPVPLDLTMGTQAGTCLGPPAILAASTQVSWYDSEVGVEAAPLYGVHTLPTLYPRLESPEMAVADVTAEVEQLAVEDHLLVTLGGEHTLTAGVVLAFKPRYPDLVVVQIDARPDLHDLWHGTAYSFATVGRRIAEQAPLFQFGIRSLESDEIAFIQQSDRVAVYTADTMRRDRSHLYLDALEAEIHGRPVYLTIDVSGLDPAIVPNGRPSEPGGVGWHDALDLIRRTASAAQPIVALDCVGLCADRGSSGSAYAAATLIYRTLNLIWKRRG
ncbi:MAG TPA: arginase family protein [Aggregatilineales bacterium]|nr:arginase family protein [Aggregatilineales bacterium]